MENKNIHAKLLKLQAIPVSVKRDGEAAISGRAYRYMTLDSLLFTAVPALNAVGLVLTQSLEITKDGIQAVVTDITCSDTGEFIRSEALIPQGLTPHQFGSWITYLKRYQLAAMLAVADLEDDDAHIAMPPQSSGNGHSRADDRRPSDNRGRDDDLGSCRDCGAPNKLSQQGKKYCSAKCWLEGGGGGQGRSQERSGRRAPSRSHEEDREDIPF